MKQCAKCKVQKAPSVFKADRRKASGIASICKECSAAANVLWRAEHPEAELNRKQRSRSRPPDKARSERWRRNNPEQHRSNDKAWRKANPEKARAIKARRLARKRGAVGSHTGEEVKSLFKTQRGRCVNCRKSIKRRYHVDHVMPLARGGSNYIANIQLLCPPCNLAKHAKSPELWARENGRLL